MLKALFRKQLLELGTAFFFDRKTGKLRSKSGIIRYAILYIVLFGYLGFVFFLASTAFLPLLETEMPWLYPTLMGLLAIFFGVLGSAFSTYSMMYHAKDNELLLSMPIPPSAVLLVRTSGVALVGTLYLSLVWIPAIIARFVAGNLTAAGAAGYLLLLPILAVFITVLSCFMGWIVALIASKFKNRSILTVLIALICLGVYYVFVARASELLETLMLRSDEVGRVIHTWLYPLYQMGVGAEGNLLQLLLFTLEVAALFGLTWFILTRTFIGIATRKDGGAKPVYQEKRTKNAGADAALLRKEWKRFTGSPTYMLNAGLGSVMLLVVAVGVFFLDPSIRELIPSMFADFTPILAAVLLGTCASMNFLTAPSVSLEGKSLWVLRTMPVTTSQIFAAKQKLHILFTGIPAVAAGVCVSLVLKLNPLSAVLAIVFVLAETFFFAAFGLCLNLKMPMMSWTNEAIPVKQSMGTLISMLGGMGLTLAAAGGGYALSRIIPSWAALLILTALFAGATVLLERWLSRRGTVLFESL